MLLRLEKVTSDNWRKAVFLTTDPNREFPLDERWILSNAYSLLQCIYDEEWDCRILMDGDQAVGFVFYGHLPEEARYMLCRYMIDVKYQGQGYGKAFLPLVVDQIRSQFHCADIHTSVDDDNSCAIHLYTSYGFERTEEMDDEERVYVLRGK